MFDYLAMAYKDSVYTVVLAILLMHQYDKVPLAIPK